ncbi:MAG: hypothetical protein KJZ70_13035 [Bryobacterales bacterium]|nr:hypothetical protein [Bryobacterales bacterium]
MKRSLVAPAGAWKAVLKKPSLFGANFVGMPALFGGLWGWLYLPVSSVPLVLLSVLLLLTLAAALLLLTVFTYNSYYVVHHPLQPVSSEGIRLPETSMPKRSIAALPVCLLWFAAFGFLCMSITWLNAFTLDWAKPVASSLTMVSQKPVSFYTVNAVFVGVLDAIRWLVLPLVFFAAFAGLATATLRRGRIRLWQHNALRSLRNPVYWAGWLVFLALGVWAPSKLVDWVPAIEGVPMATASMLLRFGAALALATAVWLLFLSLLARLTKQPRESVLVVTGKAGPRPA